MTQSIHAVARFLLRFVLVWLVDAVSLLIAAGILPGMEFVTIGPTPAWVVAVSAAFVMGLVNLLIRPLILMLARPLGFFVMFGVGFLVNALVLLITANLLAPAFLIGGLLQAIVASIVLAIINAVLTGIIELDDEGSFFQNRIERQARRHMFAGATETGRGLVMMEIDGLSYHHLHKALADGLMPTLQQMIDEQGYVLSKVDCGIPSQTSACQAGILFGDNDDIPAFRWYDKSEQRLIVSTKDATYLNARYANGNGLLRGGSSIGNMLNGDAEKSLLTVADIKTDDKEQQKRRAEDIRLLMLHPYFFMRTIALFFGVVLRELWEGWQQRRKDVYPRLNRLHGGYPFIRAATSTLVRDLTANLTLLDIVRGSPSIYITWPGYDEVAHHSGPWTSDAFGELKRYDRVIARVQRTIQEKAPRPYDLVLLSDHGQSFGPTFKMRYGVTLKEFIEQHLPQGVTVAQSMGGDTGMTSLTGVSGELANVQQQEGGAAGRAVAKQGQKLIEQGAKAGEPEELAQAAQVTAYGSGNLAQVYFDLQPRKITLSELNEAYPGMVDALVQHEGIGLVCGYLDDGTPVALSKAGQRNLHSGEVTRADPLLPYAPADPAAYGHAAIEKRIWQVRRVMDFPHAGDLMVISTVYPDGTVAALEELIGNHGGIGGEQTDAFLFHPADVLVPDTRNSTDVFQILNAVRGTPVPPNAAGAQAGQAAAISAWSSSNLARGIGSVGVWVGCALRALILERSAYREVAQDALMTGPALLIAVLAALVEMLVVTGGFDGPFLAIRLGLWLLAVLFIFAAGRLLSGKGAFTRTFRAVGFAQVAWFLGLLALIPPIAPLARLITVLYAFFAVWLGAAEAHETKGWRTVVFPVVALLLLIVVGFALRSLLAGAEFALSALFNDFGLAPQP
ncbi:MAG: phage holin family protein [Anaerolineae bacterium]